MPIPLREETRLRLDVKELASLITDRTKLIILNSPQNPTGGVLTKKDMLAIADAIGDRNIMILSRRNLQPPDFRRRSTSRFSSVPGFKDRTILLDGFSKTYAMTGWRMGYGVMRPDLATQVSRLMTNSNSCTASFTQIAGIEALTGDQASVDKMSAEFKRRRDVFVAGLNKIKGFSCRVPQRRLLRVPEHNQNRLVLEETCRRVARRSRSRLPVRHGVRCLRRGLSALQHGQFTGKLEQSPRTD